MKRSIILLALAWALVACDKETTIAIPETIDGTTWTAAKPDGSLLSLVFEAETYSLEQYKPNESNAEQTTGADTDELPAETRTYRYARPIVELLKDNNVILSGEITTDGKTDLMMLLHNADDSTTETLFKITE